MPGQAAPEAERQWDEVQAWQYRHHQQQNYKRARKLASELRFLNDERR
jgi:hypothetical protein